MNEALIHVVFSKVKEACYADTNHFGKSVFTNHILEVVKHGASLARESQADEEIVILAALLHDYAGILDYSNYGDHHTKSAALAIKLLTDLSYPIERAKRVATCILEHRGSKSISPSSLESICLLSADAMAHITKWPSLLHYAQSANHLNYREAKIWVFAKLQRSWHKMSEHGRLAVKSEFQLASEHLNSEMAS